MQGQFFGKELMHLDSTSGKYSRKAFEVYREGSNSFNLFFNRPAPIIHACIFSLERH